VLGNGSVFCRVVQSCAELQQGFEASEVRRGGELGIGNWELGVGDVRVGRWKLGVLEHV